MKRYLDRLLANERLTLAELREIFSSMLDGALDPYLVAGFLTALRAQGEGTEELVAGATEMRLRAHAPSPDKIFAALTDNCGTGGDNSGSFNISTCSAIVAASCGAKVAKHGNRSVSSLCGSADLLFHAGYPQDFSPRAAAKLLAEKGFTFFFAPKFHPALTGIMPIRKALGIRTVFNFLGPLANPIAPENQIIGVGVPEIMEPMARALSTLGAKRIMIVHSRDGMDEISSSALTDAVIILNGSESRMTIDPKKFGINGVAGDERGRDVEYNMTILNDILDKKPIPQLRPILLNTAALLWIADEVDSIEDGIAAARTSIESGAARDYFDEWIIAAQAIAKEHGDTGR